METVARAFCDSVCTLLEIWEPSSLTELASEVWRTSATDDMDNRTRITVMLSFSRGVWKYDLLMSSKRINYRSISLDEFKLIDKRHVQVVGVHLDARPSHRPRTSTLEGILEIARCTFPFLAQYMLSLHRISDFPEKALLGLLSLYGKTTPCYISVTGEIGTVVEDFLKTLLRSDSVCLDTIAFREGTRWSEDLRMAVEEFALSHPSCVINAQHVTFSKTFLEYLLGKPVVGYSRICARFSMDFEELRECGTDFQDNQASDRKTIVWNRPDGICVTVENIYPEPPTLRQSLASISIPATIPHFRIHFHSTSD